MVEIMNEPFIPFKIIPFNIPDEKIDGNDYYTYIINGESMTFKEAYNILISKTIESENEEKLEDGYEEDNDELEDEWEAELE